jgi:HEPN domain-containing protein
VGERIVIGQRNADYRLKLAFGFLQEARQDVELARWRSAVDNAQLAVENAAKAALALLGPVGRTHNPATQLREALSRDMFKAPYKGPVESLAEYAEVMGPDVHIKTDYGDEIGGRTPWDLFTKTDAQQALAIAEHAVSLADKVVRDLSM